MKLLTKNLIGPILTTRPIRCCLSFSSPKWIPSARSQKMLSNLAMENEGMDDREKVLGFKPQKENIYNKLLPDSDLIDQESNEVFAEIKGNIGRSIQLRDIKFGAGHWVGQLSR